MSAAEARGESLEFQGVGKGAIVTVDGVFSDVVWAGELNWEWLAAPPDGFTQVFFTYCVDIANAVVNPQEVTLRSTNELSTSFVADAGARAARLFTSLADKIRETGSDIQAAALQVAIWEAIYDPTFDLASGNFQLMTGPYVYGGQETALAIFAQADDYLSALQGTSLDGASAIWIDAAIPGQDQITRVPEPASLALLGLGAFIIARFSRVKMRARR